MLPKEDLEQRAIDIRRERIADFLAKGYRNYAEISRLTNVPYTTVLRDIAFFEQKAKENIQNWVSNSIPMHLFNAMRLYNGWLRGCVILLDQVGYKDPKLRLSIMSFIMQVQEGKTELTGNTMIAQEMMQMLEQKNAELIKLVDSGSDKVQDQDDDQDQVQEQEEVIDEKATSDQ
jgi:hypothetical protein